MSRRPASRRVAAAAFRCALAATMGLAGMAMADEHTFQLNAPDAHVVYLAGEMTAWDKHKLPMQRDGDGMWRVTVNLSSGEWLYKFIVDGRWIADPASPDHDSDGQGGQHSFVFVGAGDWDELPSVPKGHTESFTVESKAWGRPMKVNVYLPPGYARGTRYPVLWLLHGSGMDADQWLKTGKVDRYMDNLAARGVIHPFIVVMPSSGDVPYTGMSDTFVSVELPAWLVKTYDFHPERATSAVAGMSMGGFGAFVLPLRHPDLYGFGFALSGYYSNEFIASLSRKTKLPMQERILCGTDDALVDTNRRLVRALKERHLDFYYREDAGAHTWQYWSGRMVEMLTAVDAYFALAHPEVAPQ